MLQRVVVATRALGVEHEVIALVDGGEVADALRAEGVVVRSLSMRRTGVLPDVSALWRLVAMVRASEADLVQAWMYHANLLAALASPLAGTGRAVWGIRAASLPAGRERRRTIALARVSALLASALARSVIVNGDRARQSHIAAGYPADRMVTIPNGYDLERWRPDPESRRSVRAELGLSDDALLIGLIANFRPIKDHRTALRAVARLRRQGLEVHLLLAGVDTDLQSPALTAMIRDELGSLDGVSALGSRSDVPRLVAALDVALLTSIDESFPNAVAEAMATGIPVVTTDAGDVRSMLGTDANVVAVGDHVALSERLSSWLTASRSERLAHGDILRSRIAEHYSLDHVARQFVSHWTLLAGR